ncbi:hypothetical protein [Flavobacterium johnsoniae]|uniref:DUF3168 domain-containing protein n=1 Tax=Flavobacterium johnsoniae TaxID=986 RepID=A0A1M5IH92_FLAJO|nr:hypothetical protein [Flavobacterium johnsoniae]SHG27682.1 hypothetical protein SAMN05444388_102102 [Flavobacterium johnsoniae]
MFKSVSDELFGFFSGLSDFNAVMKREVDGNDKTFLFPIVALEGNTLPLTTYYLGERTPDTKDRSQLNLVVIFWFDQSSYDACCAFADVMVNKIDEKYNFLSASIDYNEESFTYSAMVSFNLL